MVTEMQLSLCHEMQRSLLVKFVRLHQSQFFRDVNHQFLCTHLTPTEIYWLMNVLVLKCFRNWRALKQRPVGIWGKTSSTTTLSAALVYCRLLLCSRVRSECLSVSHYHNSWTLVVVKETPKLSRQVNMTYINLPFPHSDQDEVSSRKQPWSNTIAHLVEFVC